MNNLTVSAYKFSDPTDPTVMFVGDSHCNTGFMVAVIRHAASLGVNAVVQLGDFGFWPGDRGNRFLATVKEEAVKNSVHVFWIDGNHENHDCLEIFDPGLSNMAANLTYLSRGERWEWAGVRFGALGGAFSIDRQHRKLGVSYFDQETVTGEDVERLGDGMLDVLLTHEAPAGYVFDYGYQLPETKQVVADGQRILVREAVRNTRALTVFHGHQHHRYRYDSPAGFRVEGLAHDGTPNFDDAVLVIKLNDLDRHHDEPLS